MVVIKSHTSTPPRMWQLNAESMYRAHERAYRRAGFREIGRRRQAHRSGREQEDVVFMDCLSTDFERPQATRNS